MESPSHNVRRAFGLTSAIARYLWTLGRSAKDRIAGRSWHSSSSRASPHGSGPVRSRLFLLVAGWNVDGVRAHGVASCGHRDIRGGVTGLPQDPVAHQRWRESIVAMALQSHLAAPPALRTGEVHADAGLARAGARRRGRPDGGIRADAAGHDPGSVSSACLRKRPVHRWRQGNADGGRAARLHALP